jgi:hypothetical protein
VQHAICNKHHHHMYCVFHVWTAWHGIISPLLLGFWIPDCIFFGAAATQVQQDYDQQANTLRQSRCMPYLLHVCRMQQQAVTQHVTLYGKSVARTLRVIGHHVVHRVTRSYVCMRSSSRTAVLNAGRLSDYWHGVRVLSVRCKSDERGEVRSLP